MKLDPMVFRNKDRMVFWNADGKDAMNADRNNVGNADRKKEDLKEYSKVFDGVPRSGYSFPVPGVNGNGLRSVFFIPVWTEITSL